MAVNVAPLHKAMMLTETVLKNDHVSVNEGSELLKLASDLLRVVMRRPTKYFSVETLHGKLTEKPNGLGRSL